MKRLQDLTANDFATHKIFCECKEPEDEIVGYWEKEPTFIPAGEKPTILVLPVRRCKKCGYTSNIRLEYQVDEVKRALNELKEAVDDIDGGSE